MSIDRYTHLKLLAFVFQKGMREQQLHLYHILPLLHTIRWVKETGGGEEFHNIIIWQLVLFSFKGHYNTLLSLGELQEKIIILVCLVIYIKNVQMWLSREFCQIFLGTRPSFT